jgi:FtsP/CotA-like multicopper oxidase with cupredoxin domain
MKKSIYIFILLLLSQVSFAQQEVNINLIARNTGEKGLANLDTIRVFGFAQSLSAQPNIPGPTLIFNEGDSVNIDVWNVSQGAPHTIHLHGLDVDQQNDGVPHLSFDIEHMAHGVYSFIAPAAGTYLYHCHVASTIHVQAGMYGLIIIRPPDGSNTTWDGGHAFDNEYSYFLSEIDTNWHHEDVLLHEHDTALTVHYLDIPVFDPHFFLVNGFSDQQITEENMEFTSSVNETDYTRLANIGYCGTRIIFPAELNARIVASDGRPLPVEELSDTVVVLPGERYGVLTEALTEFTSQIIYEYFDLNTMNVKNQQFVPVTVAGYANIETISEDAFHFRIVPNPFTIDAFIEFELKIKRDVRIVVYDAAGKVVSTTENIQFESGFNKFAVSDLIQESGNYFIQMILDDEVSSVKKAMKL